MSECIRLQKVHKRYGRKEILTGVDLTVTRGELVVIKGKSGSGKSTLLNIIGLLDSFNAGELFFDEKRIANERQRIAIRSGKIGFIFQAYCLIENLNVMDNVLMPFLYTDDKIPDDYENYVKELLDAFGLSGFEKKKVKNLSGGEKQRVAIVRAMVRKPLLIVADEPTGNLDPENSDIVAAQLKRYTEAGNSVIVVTHSDDCFNNADKTYMLKDGILV